MNDTVTFGLKRNIANGLIWLFLWVSGIVFFFSEKNDQKIRHNAMQSIICGLVATVLSVLSFIPIIGFIFRIVSSLLVLGILIIAILNFTGKEVEIPVISGVADSLVEKLG